MKSESTTASTTDDWARTLLAVLADQEALVSQLAALGQRQTELISAARTDALLELLTHRQEIIQRFTVSQERLAELTGDLESRLDTLAPERRSQIEGRIAAIGERLADVMERDAADQQALEAARNRTREEIGTFATARHARQAYLDRGVVSNRFADRRG